MKKIRWLVVGMILCIISIWGIMLYSDYSNISKEEDALTIYTFLSSLGQNNYEFEDEKINSFLAFLEVKIAEYFTNIKVKGVLTEKIMLAVGLIISILVW